MSSATYFFAAKLLMGPYAIAAVIIILIVAIYLWNISTRPANVFRDNYYFDWNATTPLLPAAAAAMARAQNLGNASAAYAADAKAILDATRESIRSWAGLDASWSIAFTSGGSESICTWLRSLAPGTTLITSAAEHKTTLLCAQALSDSGTIFLRILPVAIDGAIDPAILRTVLEEPAPGPRAVSLVAANNETGTLTDLAAVYAATRAAGATLHVDAVQTFGKYPGIGGSSDAFSASAHKFGGPQGVGILACRTAPAPLISGTQQAGTRGGTENISGIAGLGAALEHIRRHAESDNAHMSAITAALAHGLGRYRSEEFAKFVAARGIHGDNFNPYATSAATPHSPLLGNTSGVSSAAGAPMNLTPRDIIIVPITGSAGRPATPNTLQFAIVTPGRFFCNLKLRDALAARKIIIGVGSACNAGKPNHVLAAIGAPKMLRSGVIRLSVGPTTSHRDVAALLAALPLAIAEQLAR